MWWHVNLVNQYGKGLMQRQDIWVCGLCRQMPTSCCHLWCQLWMIHYCSTTASWQHTSDDCRQSDTTYVSALPNCSRNCRHFISPLTFVPNRFSFSSTRWCCCCHCRHIYFGLNEICFCDCQMRLLLVSIFVDENVVVRVRISLATWHLSWTMHKTKFHDYAQICTELSQTSRENVQCCLRMLLLQTEKK